MNIKKITGQKKEYLDLLLLADEQENMIDRYLERGEMFVLEDNGVKAECVVTKEYDGVYELKNIAVKPESQRKGYGKRLIEFVIAHYPDCDTLLVGTGDCPSSLSFYRSCGFTESHRVKNFIIDNYDQPIYEDGRQLVDMVYLKYNIKGVKKMYSEISIETVKRFRMARYVVISPCPEDDAMRHMREWAQNSGLLGLPDYTPKLIGWDFPFVSEDQKNKFGSRGYAAAYVIPEDFQPACEGAELAYQDTDTYAKITVTDPFSDPFTKIQSAYQRIYDYSREQKILAKSYEGRICMEEVYEKDGTTYMDVYVPVDVTN